MPVIPTTWEAQVGGLAPRPTLRPYLKNNLKEKRKKKKKAGDVAQVAFA
jgi:hypothetical protein